MAFHTDAQRIVLALGELTQALFCQIQLLQHSVGHRHGTGQPQASPFMPPNDCSNLFMLWAQSRLNQIQHARSDRQRPLVFDFLDAAEVDSLKHSDDQYS